MTCLLHKLLQFVGVPLFFEFAVFVLNFFLKVVQNSHLFSHQTFEFFLTPLLGTFSLVFNSDLLVLAVVHILLDFQEVEEPHFVMVGDEVSVAL